MKNLINKVRHHGKKVTIYLKSQPKWVVRCMFGIGAVLGLGLSLHMLPIGGSRADNEATITHYQDSNITYTLNVGTDTEEDFVAGTITITDGEDTITILDRNLGATASGTGCEDMLDLGTCAGGDATYGYLFQRGNNYGFKGTGEITTLQNGQVSGDLVSQGYMSGVYYNSTNNWVDENIMNLWGGNTDDYFEVLDSNNWQVDNPIERQGPCPNGFHIPSYGELKKLVIMVDENANTIHNQLLIPFASRRESSSDISRFGENGSLWSSSPYSSNENNYLSRYLFLYNTENYALNIYNRAAALSIRCIYNSYDIYTPDIESLHVNFIDSETIIASGDIVSGSTATGIKPSDPVRTGFSFAGWYETGLDTPFDFDTEITGNLDLYAGWINIYQVNFIDSGDIIASGTVISGSTATGIKPSDPVKTGFNFVGWYESGASSVFDFTTPINADLDLYAMWTEIITNHVNFIDSGTIIASGTVVSGSTATGIKPSDPQKSGYIFSGWYESGASVLFDFTTPITGDLNLYALWMEIITNQVFFIDSGTIITSGTVVSGSTATGIKPSDPQKSGYTFSGWYESGASTLFDFTTPITENLNLYALWIDVPPTCNVIYNITGWTNQNVTATITGCSEAILGSLSHVFTGNGTYTFEFQDLVGNTGTANATVSWITDNTTYINVEGYQFSWNNLTICNSNNSRECITMMDRNLGATTNDTTKTGSYGYKYQWGNNYGFKDGCWVSTGCSDNITSGALSIYASGVEWRNIYNNSGYYGKVFIKGGLNSYWSDYKVHNHLWGGGNDNSGSNWGYPVSNPADRQGPCPDGYHVPSAGERSKVVGRWIERSNTGVRAQGYKGTVSSSKFLNWISDHSGSYAFLVDFNIPLAGVRDYYNGRLGEIGEDTYLWTSTAPGNEAAVFAYHLDGKNNVEPWNHYSSSTALPVRCFKNTSGYNSANTGNNTGKYFSIIISNTVNAGEYTDFTVKVIKNGQIYRNYAGSVFFEILDSDGNILKDYNLYSLPNNEWYDFEISDYGKKTFRNGLRINKAGTYKLLVIDLFEGNFLGSVTFVVRGNHSSANVTYNTSKFDSKYSDEMNRAYQYARYYKITTKDTIREANMYSGLTRVAMAKMLTNYAENVLGINDFDNSKNCKFKDVSNALDKQYDYGVTKACQLGIMGVNMKNNNFNPYDPVTRAQFATALSRLLFLTKDGTDKYYSTHISKLQRDKIITNTDPTLKELRGYVMLMLMRVGK